MIHEKMKTAENISLVTAGELLGGLKKLEKNHWDDCVVAWMKDDERTFGIIGTGEDRGGDIKIVVEEADEVLEGFWTVADVTASLEGKEQDARVYMEGDGLYLAIDSDGGIFTEADDDDTVGCYVTVFGKYDENPVRKKRDIPGETTALIAIMAGSIFIVFYKAYALITGTGGPVWESVLYIVGSTIAAAVCGLTLYYSKRGR